MASKKSAGLIMFRWRNGELEVLLAHPGGPFFKNKDDGHWSIPKGEPEPDEDLLARAKIEFEEEIGFVPASWGEMIDLGSTKQKGGKIVFAWAFAGDLPNDFRVMSNTCEVEWPPRSGKFMRIPEVDQAQFFLITEARRKMKEAQTVFLDRLIERLRLKPEGSRS